MGMWDVGGEGALKVWIKHMYQHSHMQPVEPALEIISSDDAGTLTNISVSGLLQLNQNHKIQPTASQ